MLYSKLIVIFIGLSMIIIAINSHIGAAKPILLFPEWEHSESAFEREFYDKIYVERRGIKYCAYYKNEGEETIPLFTRFTFTDPQEIKGMFKLNLNWNIRKIFYDTLSKEEPITNNNQN